MKIKHTHWINRLNKYLYFYLKKFRTNLPWFKFFDSLSPLAVDFVQFASSNFVEKQQSSCSFNSFRRHLKLKNY